MRMLIVVTFLFTQSCDIINPAEPVPAYIHIDSILLTTDVATEGSASAFIADAWVYVDGTVIGTFELPATIPVIADGSHQLSIKPGILIDGIAASRTNYPFYASFDSTMNFEPGVVKSILPRTRYNSSATFLIDDFDQIGRSLVRTSSSDTDLVAVQNSNSFEGKSGEAYLDGNHDYFECAWKDSFELALGSPAYVELNYKGDFPITIGLFSYRNGSKFTDDIVTFRATQTWKKGYVSLAPILLNAFGASGFKVYIKSSLTSGLTNGTIYIDNIKVVH